MLPPNQRPSTPGGISTPTPGGHNHSLKQRLLRRPIGKMSQADSDRLAAHIQNRLMPRSCSHYPFCASPVTRAISCSPPTFAVARKRLARRKRPSRRDFAHVSPRLHPCLAETFPLSRRDFPELSPRLGRGLAKFFSFTLLQSHAEYGMIRCGDPKKVNARPFPRKPQDAEKLT